jgi:hypothetical protein
MRDFGQAMASVAATPAWRLPGILQIQFPLSFSIAAAKILDWIDQNPGFSDTIG